MNPPINNKINRMRSHYKDLELQQVVKFTPHVMESVDAAAFHLRMGQDQYQLLHYFYT